MWYTTRHEGFDGAVASRKSKGLNAVIPYESLLQYTLRVAVPFLAAGSFGLLLVHAVESGGVFSPILQGAKTSVLESSCYLPLVAACIGLRVIGSLWLATFQALLADDASMPRGFAAGSKMLAVAAAFLNIGSVCQLVAYIWLDKNYSELWLETYRAGGSDWLFFAAANVLFDIGVIILGPSLALLERYLCNDEEHSSFLSNLSSLLLVAAGAFEISGLFESCGVGPILMAVAFAVAVLRGCAFEKALEKNQVMLQETELEAEVEQGVEKYAGLSPYNLH
ncbi:MAG: hypothetical protein KVP17_005047 [Porospora cf. gigantea B]|uniref:uncharacterized protein n=1 Tax=Porospora cf. gigantea B TaxID=2853592 RepID=UPI0035719CE2|nr:MAG: hypothetical protein KVP17_005047 [Porospora cf. gigantea B]